MQLDPVFAAAVAAGADEERELGEKEREMLRNAGIAAVLADHGGRRRAQVLGNLASEFVLTLAEASRAGLGLDVLEGFPASEAFHAAIRAEKSLPLAFGAWLGTRLAGATRGLAAALGALECGMARARRLDRPAPAPAPRQIALAPASWLLSLPDGTFEHAQRARAALDAGGPAPPPEASVELRTAEWVAAGAPGSSPLSETVLLVVGAERKGHRLREVSPERLEPDVASLLRAAERPLGDDALAALADERGWRRDELDEFVVQLVADGVLRRG
jgi:hypothetical protein